MIIIFFVNIVSIHKTKRIIATSLLQLWQCRQDLCKKGRSHFFEEVRYFGCSLLRGRRLGFWASGLRSRTGTVPYLLPQQLAVFLSGVVSRLLLDLVGLEQRVGSLGLFGRAILLGGWRRAFPLPSSRRGARFGGADMFPSRRGARLGGADMIHENVFERFFLWWNGLSLGWNWLPLWRSYLKK